MQTKRLRHADEDGQNDRLNFPVSAGQPRHERSASDFVRNL